MRKSDGAPCAMRSGGAVQAQAISESVSDGAAHDNSMSGSGSAAYNTRSGSGTGKQLERNFAHVRRSTAASRVSGAGLQQHKDDETKRCRRGQAAQEGRAPRERRNVGH